MVSHPHIKRLTSASCMQPVDLDNSNESRVRTRCLGALDEPGMHCHGKFAEVGERLLFKSYIFTKNAASFHHGVTAVREALFLNFLS